MSTENSSTAASVDAFDGAASIRILEIARESPRALHTLADEAFSIAPVTRRAPARAASARRVRLASDAPQGSWQQEVLLAEAFASELRREQRRADRSEAPLSMAVYRLDDHGGAAEEIDALVAVLRRSKRESDVIGYPAAGLITVLCPDTPESGALRFIEKIRAQGVEIDASVAAYPDCLFEDLAQPGADAPVDLPTLGVRSAPPVRREYRGKRALDVVGAVVAIVLFSPLMLLTAIAIALTSPGPIIFRQQRLGRGGLPFVFYKFRSMAWNTDDAIHRRFVADLIKAGSSVAADATTTAGGASFKIKRDPRVSAIGRLIRKTSIDELPQLFNVLRGDMSLVGPRPALPYEAENYKAWHFRRMLEVRPGITGVWQVEGRSRVPFDEMVRMDLRYIRECSLGLDLHILLKTIKVVLRCDGAT